MNIYHIAVFQVHDIYDNILPQHCATSVVSFILQMRTLSLREII